MDNGKEQVFETLDGFTRMWGDFATRMVAAGMSVSPGTTPPEAMRQLRGAMLKALGEQAEQFMRSPQFLDMMKQSMDAAIGLRQQFNDMLTRAIHETQGVARQDVDSLMLSIRHLEQRVLDRLEELEVRIDALSSPAAPKSARRTAPPKAPRAASKHKKKAKQRSRK